MVSDGRLLAGEFQSSTLSTISVSSEWERMKTGVRQIESDFERQVTSENVCEPGALFQDADHRAAC